MATTRASGIGTSIDFPGGARLVLVALPPGTPWAGWFGALIDGRIGVPNRPARSSEVARGLQVDPVVLKSAEPTRIADAATSTDPKTYTRSDVDNRLITVARSSATAAYSTAPITVTDSAGSVTITPSGTNGGDSYSTPRPMSGSVTVSIPAQASSAGRWQIGFAGETRPGDVWPISVLGRTPDQAAHNAVDIFMSLCRESPDATVRAMGNKAFVLEMLTASAVDRFQRLQTGAAV